MWCFMKDGNYFNFPCLFFPYFHSVNNAFSFSTCLKRKGRNINSSTFFKSVELTHQFKTPTNKFFVLIWFSLWANNKQFYSKTTFFFSKRKISELQMKIKHGITNEYFSPFLSTMKTFHWFLGIFIKTVFWL